MLNYRIVNCPYGINYPSILININNSNVNAWMMWSMAKIILINKMKFSLNLFALVYYDIHKILKIKPLL